MVTLPGGVGGQVTRGRTSPVDGRGSPHQIRQRHTESVGDEQQVVQIRNSRSVLPPVDCPMIAADTFPELDLGEAGVVAGIAEAFPDLPAADGYPGGHGVEWHPPHAVAIMVLCLCLAGQI